jgi:4-amino-4-deoxy-L-arabinose transferase-like glycosyltransferase
LAEGVPHPAGPERRPMTGEGPKRGDWVIRALRAGCVAAAVAYIALYLAMAFRRVPYAFELEWMEGGSLQQVERILAGQPLYVRPSVEFTSYRYAPLYFYVSAALAAVVGEGFLPLRLVSFLASLGVFALIFAMVRRETGDTAAALLATGLFAGCARICGFWLDLARVDSLYLVLLLLAAWWIRFTPSTRGAAAAGAALAAAFLTKQTAVLAALGFAAHLFLYRRRQAAVLLAVFAPVAIAASLLLDATQGGWYTRHVFRPHFLYWPRLLPFWSHDLGGALPIAGLAAVFFLARAPARSEGRRFYLSFAALMIGIAWYSRLIAGAYLNALLPACLALAVLFGLGVHEALRAAGPEARRAAERTILAGVGIQLLMLGFNPFTRVPSRADAEAGARLLQTIAGVGGEVLLPSQPYLTERALGRGHAHTVALGEVFMFDGVSPFAQELRRSWRQALCDRRFSAVITDRAIFFLPELESAYQQARPLAELGDAFWPVTGARTRPLWMYLPRAQPVSRADGAEPCRPEASAR